VLTSFRLAVRGRPKRNNVARAPRCRDPEAKKPFPQKTKRLQTPNKASVTAKKQSRLFFQKGRPELPDPASLLEKESLFF
jgi:hypothetical protein